MVLTDLESTNGTKVNGEDIQLRILRFGDMISLGRSVLLFGNASKSPNAWRDCAAMPTARGPSVKKIPPYPENPSAEFDLNLDKTSDIQNTLYAVEPPDLPQRLGPAQAAQLSEMVEYLHVRVRELLASVKIKGPTERVTLEFEQWQNVLDLQSQLADYLRKIGEPREE